MLCSKILDTRFRQGHEVCMVYMTDNEQYREGWLQKWGRITDCSKIEALANDIDRYWKPLVWTESQSKLKYDDPRMLHVIVMTK